jgi:hypothetical protein
MAAFIAAVVIYFLWQLVSSFLPAKSIPLAPLSEEPPSPTVSSEPPVAISLQDLPPDVARMVEGLSRRSLDELQRQWLNAIALIDRVGPEKAVPFIVFRRALSAEWTRRLALAEADPKSFPWPTTKAPKSKSGIDSGDWHMIGMLSYLGYRVGATNGVSAGVRHQILDLCFGAGLPPINGLEYVRSWGLPGTTIRLRKLANELASFARNGKRKRSANLSSAVADWEDDLNYLYERYYVRKFRFEWPRLD